MSQAPSHISSRSQGSLHPDDSISQVITPYSDGTFRYDLELHNDESTSASNILSSAPSDLLTTTIGDGSRVTSPNYSRLGGTASAVIVSEILGMHLGIPAAFLPKRKARKGHCWLASNGTKIFEKGKWRWRCARCRSTLPFQIFLVYLGFYTNNRD